MKATKTLSNATYTKEEALALEKEIRDAVNRTRGKIVSTVKFRLTDTLFDTETSLLWTVCFTPWGRKALEFSVNSAGHLVNTNTFYGPLSVLINRV